MTLRWAYIIGVSKSFRPKGEGVVYQLVSEEVDLFKNIFASSSPPTDLYLLIRSASFFRVM